MFTQDLAPTDAKTEAEKRAARAARFNVTVEKETEEAKLAQRVERFGLSKDQISSLDSALPDRPRKRGRNPDEQEDASRGGKRQSGGPVAPGGPRGQGRNRHRGRGRPGGGNQGQERSNGNQRGGQRSGFTKAAEDPSERKKMEERAKRFAAK